MIERLFLTVFGLGLLRPAPGTWGSLPPVVIAWLLVAAVGNEQWIVTVVAALMVVLFSIVCVRFGETAEREFGRKDPSEVVADESAGVALTLLFVPWLAPDEFLWNAVFAGIAFVSFRVFDIAKPWPINRLQNARAGWGILLDDLAAGIAALIVTQAATRALIAWVI